MFKKLLSNLPYNPNIRSDVLFYSARLRQESSVRLLGFVFLILAAVVQVSAALYSPQKTYASDPNLNGLQFAPNVGCSITASFLAGSTTNFSTITSISNTQLIPASYDYDIDANGTIDHMEHTSENPHTHNFSNLPTGTHTILVNVPLRSGPQYNNGIYHYTTCQTQITINPPGQAKVVTSKTVSDTTQGLANANGRTAKAGDELVFKLTTQNVSSTDYKNYTGRDYFGSVLQYADIKDSTELSKQGIVLDSNNYLNWTTLTLKANTTEVKTITVRVKASLPIKTADNCQITNSYGNQVMVNLACPLPPPPPTTNPPPTTTPPTTTPPTIAQNVNQAATSLPNTGPGTTVVIAFVVATVAGYLYSRSRLMAEELQIVAVENTLAGGI